MLDMQQREAKIEAADDAAESTLGEAIGDDKTYGVVADYLVEE